MLLFSYFSNHWRLLCDWKLADLGLLFASVWRHDLRKSVNPDNNCTGDVRSAEDLLLTTVSCFHQHVGEFRLIGVFLEHATERRECSSTAPGEQLDELRQPLGRHLLRHLETERACEDAFSHESAQDAGDVQRSERRT